MKKHARRLSILLTFALIMTYCLTGVFAVDELTADPETPQAEQVEVQQDTVDPVDPEIPANQDAVEEPVQNAEEPAAEAEEVSAEGEEEEADAEGLEAEAPEAANAAADDESGYTI